MSRRSGTATAIMAVCAVAVVAGLALGGGPIQARKEKRDQQRISDLRQIAANIRCQTETLGQIPDAPLWTATCPDVLELNDPSTGAAYEYARIDDRHWRVCAAFELPAQVEFRPYEAKLDRETGCLIYEAPERGGNADQLNRPVIAPMD